jgi:hypothetical protein
MPTTITPNNGVNIPLWSRNIKIKLAVGVIRDAYQNFSDECYPTSTFRKYLPSLIWPVALTAVLIRPDLEDKIIPPGVLAYENMWGEIDFFYVGLRWNTLCEENMTARIKECFAGGIKVNESDVRQSFMGLVSESHLEEKTIAPEDIKKSIDRWNKNGWTDYEMNKAKKIGRLTKGLTGVATLGASITLRCMGMSVFE